jgi:hypothetical protein
MKKYVPVLVYAWAISTAIGLAFLIGYSWGLDLLCNKTVILHTKDLPLTIIVGPDNDSREANISDSIKRILIIKDMT